MEVILCDISAWEYWRTPPAIRDVEIPREIAIADPPTGIGLPASFAVPPKRATIAETVVLPRLLSDLKGLSLPVHVMLPENNRLSTNLIAAHRIPQHLPIDELIDLGNGLSVVPPARALTLPKAGNDAVDLAVKMFEACGIYSVDAKTKRTTHVLNKLLTESEDLILPAKCNRRTISAYYDENGKRLSFNDPWGSQLPWSICFDRHGRSTDLWKRPPLTTSEELKIAAAEIRGITGTKPIFDALSYVQNGSASPFETKACIMLTASIWQGGESLPRPYLNRHVLFNDAARRLAHQRLAVADMLWPDSKCCIELNGESYHADRQGFKLETGRTAALQSMGYTLVEFTYEQMRDLELYDALIARYAEMLGFSLPKRTSAFLKRRQQLHSRLRW